MVTERVAPKSLVSSPPSGSIILDELLRRYLIFIGLQEFKALTVQEIKQFALLAVYRVVEKHGLEGISVESFWTWVLPGESYSHARLLPDTEEGRVYHAQQSTERREAKEGEETVILRGVEDVTQFVRRTFLNLIHEELRAESRQKRIKEKTRHAKESNVRRGQAGEESHQPLDEVLLHIRQQREGAELEAVRFVMQQVEAKMDEPELRIIHLLHDGYKPREVAAVLDLEVTSIYKTHREYRSTCKSVWNRLFGPGD